MDLTDMQLTSEIYDRAREILISRAKSFGFRSVPTRSTFQRLWRLHCTNQPIYQAPTGGRKPKPTDGLKELIALNDSGQQVSTREMAERVGVSQATIVRRIAKDKEVRFYRRAVVEKLTERHVQTRERVAKLLLDVISTGTLNLADIIFTDECMVCVGPQINRQNDGLWQYRNSQNRDKLLIPKSYHPAKTHVFIALNCKFGLVGPYFIEEIDPSNPTLNSERYQKLLSVQVIPDIKSKVPEEEFSSLWWQQDGAPCHCSQSSFISYFQDVSILFVY